MTYTLPLEAIKASIRSAMILSTGSQAELVLSYASAYSAGQHSIKNSLFASSDVRLSNCFPCIYGRVGYDPSIHS